jgi:serine/threonine-protein kinase HipA
MGFFMSQRANGDYRRLSISIPSPIVSRELKTWISEEAGPAASIDALMAVAAYFKLDTEAAVNILAEVERAVSNWRVRGRELGMSAAELEQFADAFEHREREVARSIVRERRGLFQAHR